MCDGHRDCPAAEDEDRDTCVRVVGDESLFSASSTSERGESKKDELVIIIGVATGVGVLLIAIVILIVFKVRRHHRFGEMTMMYEADTEQILDKDGNPKDGNDYTPVVQKKQRKRNSNSHSKNFENQNFVPHMENMTKEDEARLPLQMADVSDEMIEDESDDSSEDFCCDELAPVIRVV